jgi:hypothetical protein
MGLPRYLSQNGTPAVTPLIIGLFLIALVGASTFTAIWSRRDTHGRAIAVLLFIAGLFVVPAASVEMLANCKPMDLAWELDPEKEYHVLSAKLVQDIGIWLQIDGDPAPRCYELSWSNEMANKVQKAMDGSPDGAEGQFILRVDGGEKAELQVHPIPQQAPPPAKAPPEPGLTYTPEG